jgi:23S rRNA (uridine2552-2'-O)-methyltransferase
LVGIDRGPIELKLPNLRVVVGDVYKVDVAELTGELDHFDVVLSDMAPDTSGVRRLDQDRSEALFERALEIAEATLSPGGHFAAKLFQGSGFQDLIKHCRSRFDKVRMVKPPASRSASIEQYVVCTGYEG